MLTKRINNMTNEKIKKYYSERFFQAFATNNDAINFAQKICDRFLNLKESYQLNKLIVYTGAGVSYDIESMSWNDLIHKILYYRISNSIKDDSKPLWYDFYTKNSSQPLSKKDPLCAAEQLLCSLDLNGAYKNNNFYTENRYKELKLQKDVEEIIGKTPEYIDNKIFSSSKYLNIIWLAALCIGKKYSVKNIITTNYDYYLDYVIFNLLNPTKNSKWKKISSKISCDNKKINNVVSECSEGRFSFKDSSFETDYVSSNSEIQIKHVHGLIYYDTVINHSISKGELIFSESSYDNLDIRPYNWINIIQTQAFANSPILFIGFSGTDTNYRRLMNRLQKSQSYKQDRFMIQSLDDIYKYVMDSFILSSPFDEQQDEATNLNAFEPFCDKNIKSAVDIFINLIDTYDKYYMDKLGVCVLWFKDFSCLATLYENLYKGKNISLKKMLTILSK